GDVALSKRGYCKMSFMDKNASVVVGDMVETSGLGGVYPPGILVGRVREIKSDNAGAMQYAVIEPAADLNNLHEVLVILG
ncbi:MAG: rod shape-determining protein MreC, partial [Clostridia bacterium]|nr:rod shape-determining protein MreC [Clostridia bacterium]